MIIKEEIVENYFGNHYEWAVITLFYELLHLVDFLLATSKLRGINPHPTSHHERIKQLKKLNLPQDIVEIYAMIQDHSEDARYQYEIFKMQDFYDLQPYYRKLKRFIIGYNPFRHR